MTAAGKRMSIRIDKNAFEQFRKEKAPGMKMKEIAAKIGVEKTSFSHAKGQGYFSLENLSRMSKLFDVTMWNLPFVNDEAYTISFKLTTNLDLHLRAKMIDHIRGLLANGIPQDKVRDIVLSDILTGKYTRSTQSDSESKSIPMETPKATLTHSAVSEAFDEVANSEEKTLGNVISEHAMNKVSEYESSEIGKLQAELNKAKDAITNIKSFIFRREKLYAQIAAGRITRFIDYLSSEKYDRCAIKGWIHDVDDRYIKWSTIHALCRNLCIPVKERPWLTNMHFIVVNARFGDGVIWGDQAKSITMELLNETGNISQMDGYEVCEKEEE